MTSSSHSFVIPYYYFLITASCSPAFHLEIKEGSQDHALSKAIQESNVGIPGKGILGADSEQQQCHQCSQSVEGMNGFKLGGD